MSKIYRIREPEFNYLRAMLAFSHSDTASKEDMRRTLIHAVKWLESLTPEDEPTDDTDRILNNILERLAKLEKGGRDE